MATTAPAATVHPRPMVTPREQSHVATYPYVLLHRDIPVISRRLVRFRYIGDELTRHMHMVAGMDGEMFSYGAVSFAYKLCVYGRNKSICPYTYIVINEYVLRIPKP